MYFNSSNLGDYLEYLVIAKTMKNFEYTAQYILLDKHKFQFICEIIFFHI